jgi:adenylate kinase
MSDTNSEDIERTRPNILITGTPGVGKTATASLISETLGIRHINIGEIIERNKCYQSYDTELETHILDEDKLLDILECDIEQASRDAVGVVADYHACELFPERWFDLVIVLRADTHVLFDRLTSRGYNEKKRGQNMECEIMQVILEEALQSFDRQIVQELTSNTIEDMETNVTRVQEWYKLWIENNGH